MSLQDGVTATVSFLPSFVGICCWVLLFPDLEDHWIQGIFELIFFFLVVAAVPSGLEWEGQ